MEESLEELKKNIGEEKEKDKSQTSDSRNMRENSRTSGSGYKNSIASSRWGSEWSISGRNTYLRYTSRILVPTICR